MYKKIILDTSTILTAAKFKVDIRSELQRICDLPYSICILDKTLEELKGKKAAKLALALLGSLNVIKTKKDKNVDELLLDLAGKNKNIIIATQDKNLKQRLKKKGIHIITIRQKKYLKVI